MTEGGKNRRWKKGKKVRGQGENVPAQNGNKIVRVQH